jgi:hypothetical protein
MKMPKLNQKAVLVALVAAAAVALLTGVAFALNSGSHGRSGDALLTSNREKLRLCVEVIDVAEAKSKDAAEKITKAFTKVVKHPKFADWGYAKGDVDVDSGCPGEPFLLQPGIEFKNGLPVGEPKPPVVDEASVYRLFVYVVSQKVRDSVIKGDLDVRSFPQEAICENRTCRTVTTAIYLTEEEFEDKEFLTEWLIRGLELEPPKGYTPDNFKPGDPR